MSCVTIIQHVRPEGPGAIVEALRVRRCEFQLIRVHEGQPVPVSIDGIGGLVVLGGPSQAFRWRDRVYGLLFHLEVDATMVTGMAAAFDEELAANGLDSQRIVEDPHRNFPALRRIGATVCGRWADLLDGQRERPMQPDRPA